MGSPLIDDFLTGDSKAIRDLANNEAILVGFLTLVKEIDDMPDMEPRFYETSRSLYQVTALRTSDETLLASLGAFFGKPQKAAGKSLPVGLRFDPVVKHLGGARKDQTLFFKKLKTGAFYGALWPWQMDPQKVEVHLGFFSSSISDVDYQRLEGLLKKMLSRQKIETVSGGVGGEIHGISLPSFLQMSEMEEATYTCGSPAAAVWDTCISTAAVSSRPGTTNSPAMKRPIESSAGIRRPSRSNPPSPSGSGRSANR